MRRRPGLWALRIGLTAASLSLLAVVVLLWVLAGSLAERGVFGGQASDEVMWWAGLVWPMAAGIVGLATLYIISHSSAAMQVYRTPVRGEVPMGDRILESARTGGGDPEYRRSWITSAVLHAAILIGPLFIPYLGCVEPYRVPKGEGNPVVQMVQVVRPKPIEQPVLIFNPHSAISFYKPDITESQIKTEVEEETELEYEATNAMAGQMGAGGGKQGGWPDGMEDAEVRFIRLQHGGRRWDDGMGSPGHADENFLAEFHRRTGFKVRGQGESHPIAALAKYPPGHAPPFVYITGDSLPTPSARDLKVLRAYLESGGMLFGDASTPKFDSDFRGFIRSLFSGSGYELRKISLDDPIFRQPYVLPDGAPQVQPHNPSQRYAMGVYHAKQKRWMVFYHPGDLNDAWKDGASGMNRRVVEAAYDTGVNIVYHAFTHYLQETKGLRK